MADALNIIFHCFWHFIGTLILVVAFTEGLSGIIRRQYVIKRSE